MLVLDQKIRSSYYGDKISQNMTKTPEGYLVCTNVPIARTGVYEYLESDVSSEGSDSEIVKVYRTEAEVFSPETIASFEGKPATNDHPPVDDVEPANYREFLKGVTQNVRRGEGADKDKLIADLVIYDEQLIGEIEDGKREVSCGYKCIFSVDDDGKIYQSQIRGNHVAIVEEGRAGKTVKIKDEKTSPKSKRRFIMSKNVTPVNDKKAKTASFISRLVGLVTNAKDSVSEEDVTEMVNTALELAEGASTETIDNEPANEEKAADDVPGDPGIKELAELLKNLPAQIVAAMKASDNEAKDPLDEVIKDLENGSGTDEEEVIEKTDDIATDEDIDTSDEEHETSSANDSIISLVKSLKPAIASIKSADERKAVTDALVTALKAKPVKAPTASKRLSDSVYAQIAANKNRVNDSKNKTESNDSEIGQAIAKSRNPHYKG